MTLSVVIPMYRTSASLVELIARLSAAVEEGTEIVLVDDACPEESWKLASSLSTARLMIRIIRMTKNVGQYAAVQVGLAHATGDFIAIMDADLQDTPESLPRLLDEIKTAAGYGAVCSVRAGKYESSIRRTTARLYRRSATILSRGRIPLNAGMFMVMRRDAVDRLLSLQDPFIPIVPGLSRAGVRLRGVRVHREPRLVGKSSYSPLARVRLAIRGLVTLSPLHVVLARINSQRWLRLDSRPIITRDDHQQ